MSHFNQLATAFQTELNNARHDALPRGCTLHHDGVRYWWINDTQGLDIVNWECRPFPGCASLVVTTKVVLRENMRGRGLGRFFRELRHRAYRRAGFQGEIATVRTDNPAQNHLMQTMGGVNMGTFPSDFGGEYSLWLTKLAPMANVQAVTPTPEPLQTFMRAARAGGDPLQVGPTWNPPQFLQARVHEADLPAVATTPKPVKVFAHRAVPGR